MTRTADSHMTRTTTSMARMEEEEEEEEKEEEKEESSRKRKTTHDAMTHDHQYEKQRPNAISIDHAPSDGHIHTYKTWIWTHTYIPDLDKALLCRPHHPIPCHDMP
jgi:hypothetical protein